MPSENFTLPLVIAVEPSETGKSMMAKMAASTVGLGHSSFNRVTPALMCQLLAEALFFVINDPDLSSRDNISALKVAISQVSQGCVKHTSGQWECYHMTRLASASSPLDA